MRQADLEAQREFGIEAVQLMEVAGFQVAVLVDGWLQGARGKAVTVVAGSGNNGGDALVAARYLQARGAAVTAMVLEPKGELPARHLATARRLGIPCVDALQTRIPGHADVVIDGLLGTGVRLPLRPPATELIEAINASRRTVIAVDIPSGLDADDGTGHQGCVRAHATLTLGLPKPGLFLALAVGRLFVADIGLPPALFRPRRGAVEWLYAQGPIVELS
jgi:NAD(P)H-hydrate epimerase